MTVIDNQAGVRVHKGVGIASFVIGVTSMILILALFVFAGIMTNAGRATPELNMIIGFGMFFAWAVDVIGIALGRLLRPKLLGPRGNKTIAGLIIVLTAPLISTAHLVERPMLNRGRTEVVTNSVRLKASPEQVWPLIASIDNVEAQKSWMMFVGLPVPRRCTVDKPGVGGKRICYFDQGFIEETITEWTPPRSMQLTINRTNMPGRHWLDFEGATYKLQPERGGTIVSRTTMIRSGLYPAFYWRYFERMGVEAEHRYVMEDLVRRAGE